MKSLWSWHTEDYNPMRVIEGVPDQASGLRRIIRPRPVQVIAVTSGKGGVGKTNVSVNLSIALANQGKDVLLMDADLGLGNVDVLLGMHPKRNLSHVIDGTHSLEDILVSGPGGIRLLPAASGIQGMSSLSMVQHAGIIRAFSDLGLMVDTLIVDTAAGLSDSVINFSKASQEIVVVVCDEPASITDAYALIKLLHRNHGRHRFRILANMVRNANEGRDLFLKLMRVSGRFLDVSLDYMGAIPFDECVRMAVQRQRAVLDVFPRAKASLAVRALAAVADKWTPTQRSTGQLEFFIERLVDASCAVQGR